MATRYITTLADPVQIPDLFKRGFFKGHAEPRIAFVGRSNVGKSSLINALVRERVAKVSSTPGKTRAIHFFLWTPAKRIVVDLPGYGFAKVAKKDHHEWSRLIRSYFEADGGLEGLIVLWDSRHGPTPSDQEALEFFISMQIPIQILMTKFDQLKTQSDRSKRKKEVLEYLAQYQIESDYVEWISTHDSSSINRLRERFV
jgi:GTP-binding protein